MLAPYRHPEQRPAEPPPAPASEVEDDEVPPAIVRLSEPEPGGERSHGRPESTSQSDVFVAIALAAITGLGATYAWFYG